MVKFFQRCYVRLLVICLVQITAATIAVGQNQQNLDPDLQRVLEKEIDPETAIPFSEDSFAEISEVEAFCFDHDNQMMLLFSDRYEQKVMVWGPGLRYSFLAQVKRGNVKLERVNGVKPTKKALTVWAEFGKSKVRAKSPLYRVTP